MGKHVGRLALVVASALASAAPAQDRAAAQPVVAGRAIEGRLSGTEARHPLRLAAGETVRIAARSSDFDPLMKIYGPTGTEPLAEDDDSGGGTVAQLIFQAPSAGVYQVAVSESVPGDEQPTGVRTYDLTAFAAVAPVVPPLRPITPNGARPIPVDMAQCGTGCRFSFQATEGDRLIAETSADDAQADPVLELRMGNDKIAEDDDSGEGMNARLVRRIQRTGTYTLVARTLGGKGTFALAVSLHPHVARPAVPVQVGTPATGTIGPNAEMSDDGHFYDAYTLHGRAGQQVVIDLESSAFDAQLEVFGDTVLGNVQLASNDDAEPATPGRTHQQSLNSRLALTFAREGTVEVRAVSLNDPGAYTLRIAEAPPSR